MSEKLEDHQQRAVIQVGDRNGAKFTLIKTFLKILVKITDID